MPSKIKDFRGLLNKNVLTFSLGNFLEKNQSVIPIRITNKVKIKLDMFTIQPESKNEIHNLLSFLKICLRVSNDRSETPPLLGNFID
jgi:hypothetical protein